MDGRGEGARANRAREACDEIYFHRSFSSSPPSSVRYARTDEVTDVRLLTFTRRHENWVTSIATPLDNSDILLSSSRDKTVILWNLTREEENYGYPRRSLHGHSHFVQDVVISSE